MTSELQLRAHDLCISTVEEKVHETLYLRGEEHHQPCTPAGTIPLT